MTRELSSGMAAAVAAPVVRPILFAELSFRSVTWRGWTGRGTVSWSGQDWVGYGAMLGFDGGDTSIDGSASQARLTLSGVASEYLALAYSDEYQGRPARIWLGAIDDAGAIVEEPAPVCFGLMDTMADADDGASGSLAMTIQTQMLDQRRPRIWRLTDAHQRELFPGDKGLEFVAGLEQKKIVFGG